MTPLMYAANKAITESESPTESGAVKIRLCDMLVNLGADKSIVNPSGYTALGCFRLSRRAHSGMNLLYSGVALREDPRFNSRLEALLMPADGETPADSLILRELNSVTSSDESDEE